jgi:hypothetical protein
MKRGVKLSPYLAQWVDRLVKARLLGVTREQVVENLLQRALHDMTISEYVQKHFSMLDSLRSRSDAKNK